MTGEVEAGFARTLVDEWVRGGVSDAVVVPSIAVAPLALALVSEGRIRVHVIVDERAAAFLAVGLGMSTGRPALVVTSGGVGLAQMQPALAEAHRAGVPLIVCASDVPSTEVLADGLRWVSSLGPVEAEGREGWRPWAARALDESLASPAGPGPVLIGVSFGPDLTLEPGAIEPGRADGRPWTERTSASVSTEPTAPEIIDTLMRGAGRGLVVAGAGTGDATAVHAVAAALGWPVLADPLSGCRRPESATVAAADLVLRSRAFVERHRPDVVLRLGAAWASDAVAQALEAWDAPTVTGPAAALAQGLTARGAVRPDADTAYLDAWVEAERAAQAAIDAALADIVPITEPWLARVLVANLPDGCALVTSSSMPRRDVESFSRPRSALRVLAGWGTNADVGAVSMALGVAAGHAGPTVALVGDLAFLRDVNALMAIAGTAAGLDCTIVVVDNDGAGRFSFDSGASALPEGRFERIFGTPHGLDIPSVAAAHGAPAYRVAALPDFLPTVEAAIDAGGVRVVHVRTDRRLNVAVHQRINDAATAVVTALAQPRPSS